MELELVGERFQSRAELAFFAIGFPISMVTGLLIIWLTLGGFYSHFDNQFGRTMQMVCSVVELEC